MEAIDRALDRRPNVFENNKLYFDAIYITSEDYIKNILFNPIL